MAGRNADAPIVIKKIKKGGGHGHHGGAWKVAYADFVTAMMAFFLLLWLLNATTEEQKKAISNYFAPESVSATKNGSGGLLGGTTMTAEGAMVGRAGTPGVVFAMPPPSHGKDEDEDAEGRAAMEMADAMQLEAERNIQELSAAQVEQLKRKEEATTKAETEEAKRKAEEAQEKERKELAAAAQQIRQAIQEIPELARLAENVVVDQTEEGLRIQLVDQERIAMFPTGSAVMNPQTRALLEQVKKIVANLPQRLAIAGHTDSVPFPSERGYSNWELSSDRANASRRALIEMGLPAERIARVVGRADTDPLVPSDPRSPRNRRISITLLKQTG